MNIVTLEGEVIEQETKQGKKNTYYLIKVRDEAGNVVPFITWRQFELGTWLSIRGHLISDNHGVLRLSADELYLVTRV